MSTQAYLDLMFAWGHARLGDVEVARRLIGDAGEWLHSTGDPAHAWLLDAFTFRIEQALAGAVHRGSAPASLLASYTSIDQQRGAQNSRRYIVDRLREQSRILEPDDRVDPYLAWKRHGSGPIATVEHWLVDDHAATAGAFDSLRCQAEESADVINLCRFYRIATEFRGPLAGHVGNEVIRSAWPHAVRCLEQEWATHPDARTWAARHKPTEPGGKDPEEWAAYRADIADPAGYIQARIHADAADILLGSIRLAQRLGRTDLAGPQVDDFFRLAGEPSTPPTAVRALCALFSQLLFHRLWPRDRAQAERVSDLVTDEALAERFGVDGWRTIPARIGLAAINYWLGRDDRCRPAKEAAIQATSQAQKPTVKTAIACQYLDAAAQRRWPGPLESTLDLFAGLPRVRGGYTTDTHFSRLHLKVAERAVFAIATSDFGPTADVLRSMPADEIASRREALAEIRGRLVEWSRPY